MKFLIDAQLPRRAVRWLQDAGFDAVHTLDFPAGNASTDAQIIELADREQRVVAIKDSDFVDSHMLHRRPGKLLLISTGNASNLALEAILRPLVPAIVREFQTCAFLEVGRAGLIVRG